MRAKLESLKQKLELDRVVDKLPWTNFNAPFAFYYFVIDNVVKCGAVGLKDQENPENLNSRLTSDRSTHAKLKLINVIKFGGSSTVTLFEGWIKLALTKYSIGTDASLEQYECPGKNSEKILNDIILEQLSRYGQYRIYKTFWLRTGLILHPPRNDTSSRHGNGALSDTQASPMHRPAEVANNWGQTSTSMKSS